MTKRAIGPFEVSTKPQGTPGETDGVQLGRMLLEKQFFGDLAGTGRGEMPTAMTATQGSAGYVAIERVTGTLHGRQGSFVFQHSGTMDRGKQHLSITVVPDSGSAELAGITGNCKIDIVDGKHFYEFEYSLP
ncbi:MAG: DUF3224 domain-containing protein [Betaproteobacteria bacterium]|nr:MAG: DUF3224 domain-containing protein [Betaproteobacteria bacterium]